MKNNGKKMGLAGTIIVLLLYVVLQWTGIISPKGEDAQENSQYQQSVEVTKSVESGQDVEATQSVESDQGMESGQGVQESEGVQQGAESEAAETSEESTQAANGEETAADNSQSANAQEPDETEEVQESTSVSFNDEPASNYEFRNQRLEDNHYEKHGIEMGFDTVEDYIAAANKVIDNPDSLHKLEAEDNDHIYFLEETNEFVVLSQDGYIRTYYIANGGIDYFNRQ